MSTATSIEAPPAMDMGRLANNGTLVLCLQRSLSVADMNVGNVISYTKRIDKENAWRDYLTGNGKQFRFNAPDFRSFIESPRSEGGCETPLHVLLRIVLGTDAEEVVKRLTRGNPGGANNPDGLGGWTGKGREVDNRNNITDDNLGPDIIPLPVAPPRPARNYARESKQGTSVSYALRRLEKARPDLLEKVKEGELSPHKAMVIAEFVEKQITIPADVTKASRRLLLHFKGDELMRLATELANHAGYDLVPKE